MNQFERAVIEAARLYVQTEPGSRVGPIVGNLLTAVRDLDEHERAMAAAGVATVEWALVVAGDEIQGASGAFFPVLKVKPEYVMGKYTGRRIITVQLKTGPKDLIRPRDAQPFATVRRGRDGRAVDEFVNVFSSGEA